MDGSYLPFYLLAAMNVVLLYMNHRNQGYINWLQGKLFNANNLLLAIARDQVTVTECEQGLEVKKVVHEQAQTRPSEA